MDPMHENGAITDYNIYSCMANHSYPKTLIEKNIFLNINESEWIEKVCIGKLSNVT